MKTSKTMRWMSVLPLAALLGCGATQTPEPESVKPQSVKPDDALATLRASLEDFTFDSTALAQTPSRVLPSTLLPQSAFDSAVLKRSLLQTTESFTTVDRDETRTGEESPSWVLESDRFNGQALVVGKVESGPAVPQDEAVLQRSSLERLRRWGLPSTEVGSVRQVQSLLQDEDGTVQSAPTLHRYKTFVQRAINGIRVQGHRAVVSHGVDGAFQRSLVTWPALAREGHRLTTRLTIPEIETRTKDILVRLGETGGRVRLLWQYEPTQLTTGEVVLTLKVTAVMPSLTDASLTEEPRIVDVDVNAL